MRSKVKSTLFYYQATLIVFHHIYTFVTYITHSAGRASDMCLLVVVRMVTSVVTAHALHPYW